MGMIAEGLFFFIGTRLQNVLQGQVWSEGSLDTWGTHDEDGSVVGSSIYIMAGT